MGCSSMASAVCLPGDRQGSLWGALNALSQNRGATGVQSQDPGNKPGVVLPLGGGEIPAPGGVHTQAAPRPCGRRWRQRLMPGGEEALGQTPEARPIR